MNRLPHLFRLQAALEVLSRQTDVLRAVGAAADAARLPKPRCRQAEPVRERLDALCAQLWDVDERGLRAIQSAYRDLYVTTLQPGEAAELKEAAAE